MSSARMSSASTDSDQNGYAGISSNAPSAATTPTPMPKYRPNPSSAQQRQRGGDLRDPLISVIQPRFLRLPKTGRVLCTTKLKLPIAAMP